MFWVIYFQIIPLDFWDFCLSQFAWYSWFSWLDGCVLELLFIWVFTTICIMHISLVILIFGFYMKSRYTPLTWILPIFYDLLWSYHVDSILSCCYCMLLLCRYVFFIFSNISILSHRMEILLFIWLLRWATRRQQLYLLVMELT